MKNRKRLLALLLAAAMTLSLCACNFGGDADPSADPSEEVSGEPDASATHEIVADLSQPPLQFTAGLSPDDVLLTVNGEEVTADLMLYWLDYSCYYFMYQYALYGLSMEDYADVLLDDAVSICVSEVLLRQKAAELGCLPTDAQVQEAKDQIAADPETIELFKAGYGLTDSSIEYLYLADAYYNNMLAAITHEPSEEELSDYLTEQGFYRVKHILIKTVDDNYQSLPDDEVAEKQAQAEDLLAQLQAAQDLPTLFDQLMNEFSEDGRNDDGTLAAPDGYLAYSGQMDSSFEAASLALAEGEMSELVQSFYGYHIILRLPFAPFTETEKANYAESFRSTDLRNQADQWKEDAEIVWSDALTNLDVADFYAKMDAYQLALSAQEENGVG